VSNFFDKYHKNEFLNYEHFVNEYQTLLGKVFDTLGKTITQYNPIYKGQPPRSDQFLAFSKDLRADSAIIGKQIDLLASKTANMQNLFVSEIIKEQNSFSKIQAKTKVLELYSKSFSENMHYLGDDFRNSDNIETGLPYDYTMGSIVDGDLVLPLVEGGSRWSADPDKVNIVKKDIAGRTISSGFVGNSHMVSYEPKESTEKEQEALKNPANYVYYAEKRADINKLSSIIDKNLENSPTYFEYEKYNVSNLNTEAFQYEFRYLSKVNDSYEYLDWNKATDEPLQMVLELGAKSPKPANSISITPFFGYDEINVNPLAVSSIIVQYEDPIKGVVLDGSKYSTEEILQNEILIGPTVMPLNEKDSNRFFFKKAVVKFSERKVKKITMTFKQYMFSGVKIKHAYYEVQSVNGNFKTSGAGLGAGFIDFVDAIRAFSPNKIFNVNSRFSPSQIVVGHNLTNIKGVDAIYRNLTPPVDNPVGAAISPVSIVNAQLSGETELDLNYYVMKVFDKREKKLVLLAPGDFINSKGLNGISQEERDRIKKPDDWPTSSPFYAPFATISGVDLSKPEDALKFVPPQDSKFQDPNSPALLALHEKAKASPSYASGEEYKSIPQIFKNWWAVKSTLTDTSDFNPLSIYRLTNQNISSELHIKKVKPEARYYVRLRKKYEILADGEKYGPKNEILNVKRWAIGIKDIYVGTEIYQDYAQIISKPHIFPYPIEYLALRSNFYVPKNIVSLEFEKENKYISYFISVNNGEDWYPISPIEEPFSSNTPEIFAFNQNTKSELRLPGIHYLDLSYDVNSVRVKIIIKKAHYSNGTPVVRDYQLAARIKRA
jgi:hypothetical protein